MMEKKTKTQIEIMLNLLKCNDYSRILCKINYKSELLAVYIRPTTILRSSSCSPN